MVADRWHVGLAALVVGAGVLLSPAAANAYCRTTIERTASDAIACSSGTPLYHPSQCVTYRIIDRERAGVSPTKLAEVVARAFATWTAPNPTCMPGIAPVEVSKAPPSEPFGYTSNAANSNLIGFVEGSWKRTDELLALTTVVYNPESGAIRDVDMELNGDIAWSVEPQPAAEAYDLETTLLHETGHFLGLAHTDEVEAAMNRLYSPGTTRRKLAPDDALGICSIYPDRFTRGAFPTSVPATECRLAPGDPSTCSGDAVVSNGCASTPSPTHDAPLAAFAVAGLALTLQRRRRGRQHRQPV